MTLLMGAVAYDPKVVTTWSGFREWLAWQGLPFDVILYSTTSATSIEGASARGPSVQRLQFDMDDGRQRRLVHLGFPADEAAELSKLHTRNFM
jgi:hypothetical protein